MNASLSRHLKAVIRAARKQQYSVAFRNEDGRVNLFSFNRRAQAEAFASRLGRPHKLIFPKAVR